MEIGKREVRIFETKNISNSVILRAARSRKKGNERWLTHPRNTQTECVYIQRVDIIFFVFENVKAT